MAWLLGLWRRVLGTTAALDDQGRLAPRIIRCLWSANATQSPKVSVQHPHVWWPVRRHDGKDSLVVLNVTILKQGLWGAWRRFRGLQVLDIGSRDCGCSLETNTGPMLVTEAHLHSVVVVSEELHQACTRARATINPYFSRTHKIKQVRE